MNSLSFLRMPITVVAIALVVLSFPHSAKARDPVIHGGSGSTNHGGTFTIQGANFGIKPSARPWLWADFENGTISPDSVLGQQASWSREQHVDVTRTSPRSGQYAAESTTTWRDQPPGPGRNLITNLASRVPPPGYSGQLYVSFWRKATYDTALSDNWKWFRITSEASGQDIYPNWYVGKAPDGGPLAYVELCDVDDTRQYISAYPPSSNAWRHEEYRVQYNSGVGENDGVYAITINGVPIRPNGITTDDFLNWQSDCPLYPGGDNVGFRWVHILDDPSNFTPAESLVFKDDIYIDTTWSRVYLGNAATLEASSHRELQLPMAWSDSSITLSLNLGTFTESDAKYLFVVNALNEVSQGVLLRSRLPGDLDTDGDVDRRDLALFATHYGTESGSIWASGDFNGDGSTSLGDLVLLRSHLGQSILADSIVVPEPMSWVLGFLGVLSVLVVRCFNVSRLSTGMSLTKKTGQAVMSAQLWRRLAKTSLCVCTLVVWASFLTPPAVAELDTFGIELLYPTDPERMPWESTWHNTDPRSLSFGRDEDDPWFFARGDASYNIYIENGDGLLSVSPPPPRLDGPLVGSPRLYIHDPAATSNWHPFGSRTWEQAESWRDVEMTVYAKRVADDGESYPYAGIVGVARTNHGTTHRTERDYPCDSRGIAGRMRYDGEVEFAKETKHPEWVPSRVSAKQVWPHQLPHNVWLGYKYVVYDMRDGTGNVKMEIWLDETDGENGGNWIKVNEFTDDGTNFGTAGQAGVSCNSMQNIRPELKLTNSDQRPGSESLALSSTGQGKPNVAVYWRSDGVEMNGLIYKKMSVRQIIPTGMYLSSPTQLPGDASGDGVVDGRDLAIVVANWGTATGATWSNGDFTGDERVSLFDLRVVQNHFGASSRSVGAIDGAGVVPEPSTAASVLLLIVTAFVCRWRCLGRAPVWER